MARHRDWVDYANIASNIAQNVQLRDMQHKLGVVATAMQEEKDAAEREHRLREAVFQAESMLRTLQKSSKDNPRASLAWARSNLLQFQRNEVTSACFRSYEDKERLRSVVDGHEQLIQECAAGLSPQQQDQAERCGQYLMERDALNLLIHLAPKQERLARLNEELAPLLARPKFFSGYLPTAFAGFIIIGVIIALTVLDAAKGGGVILAMGIGTLFAFLYFKVPAAKRRTNLQAMIVELLSDEPLLDPAFGMVLTLRKTFGNSNEAELLKMRNDREALIADVLGEAKPQAKA